MNQKFDVAIISPSFLEQMETQFVTHDKKFQRKGSGELIKVYRIFSKLMASFIEFHIQEHQNKMD